MEQKSVFKSTLIKCSIVFFIFLVSVWYRKTFMPYTYIGESALEKIRTVAMHRVVAFIPCVLAVILAVVVIILTLAKVFGKTNREFVERNGYKNHSLFTSDHRAALILSVIVLFLCLYNAYAGSIYFAEFSTSRSEASFFSKIRLVQAIDKDMKNGETNTIECISAMTDYGSFRKYRAENSSADRTDHVYYYFLVVRTAAGESRRFMLSKSDYNFFRKNVHKRSNSKLKIEYYKNSQIIKSFSFEAG